MYLENFLQKVLFKNKFGLIIFFVDLLQLIWGVLMISFIFIPLVKVWLFSVTVWMIARLQIVAQQPVSILY